MKLHNIASRCLCLLAGVTLFTACDNETDFVDPNNRDGKPLRIETSIAETRAVVTSTNFSEGDRIGLFVLDGDGKSYTENSMNQQVTYSNNTWVMQNDIVLSGNLSPYIYAFYPHFDVGDYITGPKDVKIPINLTPNLYNDVSGQADWMYANILLTQGNTAKLTFRHALARVTLQLKRGTEEQGDGFLSLVRMQNATKYNASTNEVMGKGKKLQTYGIMSLSDGTIETYGEENANIELGTELVLSEDAQSIDLLVIPTAPNGQLCTPEANTTGGGIEILLTIDGKQYRVDLGVPTWHAGQQYIYPITINRNSAEVTPDTPVAEAVDLGLSVKWASFNVGATKPEEYGGYYAWGETEEKEEYSWATYKWCKGTETTLTKYCTSSDYGTVDGKTTLDLEDDVAHVKWGEGWRIPTEAEIQELVEKCTWTWTEQKGITGYTVSANNGNSIFLPTAGHYLNANVYGCGVSGFYWSTTLVETVNHYSSDLRFSNGASNWINWSNRHLGFAVRPVYGLQATEPVEPELTPTEGEYIDLGLPSGTLWASCNVGANSPEEAGGYYAWGETDEKEDYSWGTYNWCNGSYNSITKYCTSNDYGIIDNKTILDLEDDVAHVKLGNNWRMPTVTEFQELMESCTWTWGKYKGAAGCFVCADNGNCIFLPAVGCKVNTEIHNLDLYGTYITSSLNEVVSSMRQEIVFNDNSEGIGGNARTSGCSVRPIYDPQPTEEAGEAVDLGLSVKWASFNVGATKPEEAGGYYAWGETEEKEEYSWATYKWCKGTETSIFKYCTNSSYGTVDNKTTLDLEDDVAHVKWGGTWRMPTQEEIQELVEKCTWTWTEQNGVSGQLVTGSNGNSIFLPAAGVRNGTGLSGRGSRGDYWSATLDELGSYYACRLGFRSSGSLGSSHWFRGYGFSVRPVTE